MPPQLGTVAVDPGKTAGDESFEGTDPAAMSFPVAESAGEREAVYLNENVFRAGPQGVEDAATAIAKVQQHAHELAAVRT